MPMTYQYYYY